MDKENVVRTYNEILFSLIKEEILPHVTTWIDLEDIMLRRIASNRMNIAWSHLHLEPKIVKLIRSRK